MAEPIPAPPAERDTPGAYRPVSALAVAAFAVGVLFALLIVVLAAAGLLTGQPVLWKWPMVLGLAGAGLAGAAIWQVRASEGARTGGVLAGVALGLCVVFGLCYFAFQAADEFAVRAQTHEVAVDWFAKLSKGDVFEAFLWNLDAPAREAYRLPGDPPSAKEIADRNVGLERRFGRAELSALRDSDLLAVLRRAEGKYELEDLGVRDISYSPGGYRVSRDYRLHTPEGWFEIPLTLASAEGGDFVGGQRWQIQLSQGPILRGQKLTELGRLVVELQNESNQFAREWIRAIYEQRLDMVVLLAMPPQQRKEETARLANLVSLRDLGLAIPEPGLALGSLLGADREVRSRLITDYPSFFPKLVRGEESVLPAAGRRAWAEKSLLHEPPGPSLLTDRAAPSLRLVGDSVTVSLPCALPPPPKVTGQIKGRLLVGLEGPQIVSRLKALMSEENWRSATPVEDAGRLLKNEPRDWYIEGVEVTAEPSGRPDPRAGMPPG